MTSHHITSHHMASRHITSRHITSHQITAQHSTSHLITSDHVTSHGITSHHMTSRDMTSNHTHDVTSRHIVSQPFAVVTKSIYGKNVALDSRCVALQCIDHPTPTPRSAFSLWPRLRLSVLGKCVPHATDSSCFGVSPSQSLFLT